MIDFGDVILGLLVFLAGYLKGRSDGMDWGVEQVREIHKDLQKINEVMEDNIEKLKRNVP